MGSFRKELFGRTIVTISGLLIIVLTLSVAIFLVSKGLNTFTVHKYPLTQFLFGNVWNPQIATTDPKGQVGSFEFIVGSLLVSLIAIIIATPFAVGSALFMTEISPVLGKKLLQPAIEIFVGIPSVVYGWVGATLLCPFIAKIFKMPFGGESLLAAGIVLALMIFPTVTSVSADSIRSQPIEHKEGSYALGSTRWQMIWRVRMPAAFSGILTGIVLGISRAFGEALAVSMVIGMNRALPKNLLSGTSTLTTIIATSMGSASEDSAFTASLWTMALLLFIISLIFIVIIRLLGSKGVKKA